MAKVNLETFRCSLIESNGERCPCEFTLANGFAHELSVLARKSPRGVTLETIAKNAICPIHAKLYTAGTIKSLAEVIAEFRAAAGLEKLEADWKRRDIEMNQRIQRRYEAENGTTLGHALHAAHVTSTPVPCPDPDMHAR